MVVLVSAAGALADGSLMGAAGCRYSRAWFNAIGHFQVIRLLEK